MEANIYKAPEAELSTPEFDQSKFYVVSDKKFLILFISTLGMYSLYWFYQNWKSYSEFNNENIMPFWRAVFSIFFTHSLFKKLYQRAKEENDSHDFNHSAMATLYVILSISSTITDNLATNGIGLPFTEWGGYIALIFYVFIFRKAQITSNIASCDPQGESNNSLSFANFIWIFIGLCLWAVMIFSYIAQEQF